MKLNCYFNFEHYTNTYWAHCYMEIFNSLKHNFPEIEFTHIESHHVLKDPRNHSCAQCDKTHVVYMRIENPETKKYLLISYGDKLSRVHHVRGWDTENLVEIYTSAGVHRSDMLFDNPIEYVPFTYLTEQPAYYDEIYRLRKKEVERIVPDKLFLYSALYRFRHFVKGDERFYVRDKNDFEMISEGLTYQEYMNNFQVGFNLNGIAEICHRDIEFLGLGITLFRPKLNCKFHNELIPNYHYISVDYDDLKFEGFNGNYNKNLTDRIYQRWLEVKDDIEYLKFVASNGQKWFDENCTKDKHAKILTEIIDLNKIL